MANEESQGPQKALTAESKSSDRAVKATRAFAQQAEILDLMEQEALFCRGMQSTFEISFQEYLAVSKFARKQLLAMFKGRSMKIASENAVPEPVKMCGLSLFIHGLLGEAHAPPCFSYLLSLPLCLCTV